MSTAWIYPALLMVLMQSCKPVERYSYSRKGREGVVIREQYETTIRKTCKDKWRLVDVKTLDRFGNALESIGREGLHSKVIYDPARQTVTTIQYGKLENDTVAGPISKRVMFYRDGYIAATHEYSKRDDGSWALGMATRSHFLRDEKRRVFMSEPVFEKGGRNRILHHIALIYHGDSIMPGPPNYAFMSKENSRVHATGIESDEQGRLSCIREFNERGLVTKFIQIERETDSIKTSFSYDDEGRQVCSITTTSGSTGVYQTRYIYRKDRLHKQISYSDGHASSMVKFKYRPIKGY